MTQLKAVGIALLVAGALTWVALPSICEWLTPGSWPWILAGCAKDTAGGGDSGAG